MVGLSVAAADDDDVGGGGGYWQKQWKIWCVTRFNESAHGNLNMYVTQPPSTSFMVFKYKPVFFLMPKNNVIYFQ